MSKKTLILLVLILIAAAVSAWWMRPRKGAAPSSALSEVAAEPAAEAPPLQVATWLVQPQALDEELLVTGELRANEQVELRSEVSGVLVAIYFREGGSVARGDLLAKIRDDELQAQLLQAHSRRDLAVTREERARTLLAEDTISQEQYDEAANNLRVLSAEITLLEARLAQTEIHAPFDGVIGLRNVSEGSYVTPAVSLATLQDLDPIKLDFAIPEKYAGRVAAGSSLDFTVAGFEESFRGQVFAVEPRIDAGTRTLEIRARAANSRQQLLPGAFARVRLVLETVPDALQVPSIALVPGVTETTVYVLEDGRAQPRAVRTGLRTERAVQVLEGLSAGDRVIISGVQQLTPGAAVVPAPGAPAVELPDSRSTD